MDGKASERNKSENLPLSLCLTDVSRVRSIKNRDYATFRFVYFIGSVPFGVYWLSGAGLFCGFSPDIA